MTSLKISFTSTNIFFINSAIFKILGLIKNCFILKGKFIKPSILTIKFQCDNFLKIRIKRKPQILKITSKIKLCGIFSVNPVLKTKFTSGFTVLNNQKLISQNKIFVI
jgi:hypothetical protein